MPFMNFGYAHLNSHDRGIDLSCEDEEHRYSIQLYHHVASAIDWTGLEALELGSGRGGGAAYITNNFKPKSYIGIDMTSSAVDFSTWRYAGEGLSFLQCNAEALPFEKTSFDVVINIEASGLWRDAERTFREIGRVLKPNGYFLYTDMRRYEFINTWRSQLAASGLDLIREEDITPNVVLALALDFRRKCRLINQHTPLFFRWIFREFAGMSGAGLAKGIPGLGDRVYYNFVLHKECTSAQGGGS